MPASSSEMRSASDPPSRMASTVVDFPVSGFVTRTGAMERTTLSVASTLLPEETAASQDVPDFDLTVVFGLRGRPTVLAGLPRCGMKGEAAGDISGAGSRGVCGVEVEATLA